VQLFPEFMFFKTVQKSRFFLCKIPHLILLLFYLKYYLFHTEHIFRLVNSEFGTNSGCFQPKRN
jgi:hypothetical protein